MKKLLLTILIGLRFFVITPVVGTVADQDPHSSTTQKYLWPTERHPFGVAGTDPELQKYAMKIVNTFPLKTTSEGAVITFNHMGTVLPKQRDDAVPKSVAVAQEVIDYARQESLPVLSVGEGTGNVAYAALKMGVTFIANDIEARHLAHLSVNAPESERGSLYLKLGKFPDHVHLEDESMGGIYFGRVLHFCTGEEIEKCFKESHRILKLGAKIAGRSSSPFQKNLQFFIPTFEERIQKGESWPGICREMAQGWPTLHQYLPSFMNLLDRDTLKDALEKAGFFIERLEYTPVHHPDFKLAGREGIEFIARKVPHPS
jgi:ubiquinone/menaquinone biosynthesis C-methylase UbiE